MLTYVEVNHAALLADITVDSHERAEYNMYSAFCAGGSIRVLLFIPNILIEPRVSSFWLSVIIFWSSLLGTGEISWSSFSS